MSIDESDRLGLRQELERVFNNPRHVDTLMRSLPTTDHAQLATKADIDLLGRELRADIKTETAELTRQLAVQFRLTVLMQMGVLLAVISLMASRG